MCVCLGCVCVCAGAGGGGGGGGGGLVRRKANGQLQKCPHRKNRTSLKSYGSMK